MGFLEGYDHEEYPPVLRIASETDHEHRGGVASRGRTNAAEGLSFLASSPGRAYTPKEIDWPPTRECLSRLEDRVLVRHRGEYWAIAADEAVEKTLSSIRAAQATTDRFGLEDPEE